MDELKKLLSKEFEIKNLGQLRYFLGMEVARSNSSIYVSKKTCINLLKETRMLGYKPVDMPMD